MPQLGEIKKAFELGYRSHNNRLPYIWASCLDCGKERWVPYIKGKPKNLRCNPCSCRVRTQTYGQGESHPAWKGGRWENGNGYICVWISPDDFFYPTAATKQRVILEHRLIMAKHLGRNLHSWEIVHHRNHIRDDNRIENLQLVSDDKHAQMTILENKIIRLEKENRELRRQLECVR